MMSKAFLSHNSFDKDFVEAVFTKLGASHAVYDKVTFKKNCDLTLQINDGLDDSQIYVLFLSKASIESDWVSAEIDLAHELRTRWKIKKFLVFQLDETSWSELPDWLSRYVIACPPSPQHVALRILDELINIEPVEPKCLGREDSIKKITVTILEKDAPPSFLYLSGPTGIGRHTLASAVYKTLYKEIAGHKIKISIALEPFDDLTSIYRKLLGFSANWRVRDLINATDEFSNLNEHDKISTIANLIHRISVSFRQVVVFDIGISALDEEGKPLPWFAQLMEVLPDADYPYVWFISQRFLSGGMYKNGIFFPVEPLNEDNSKYLFKILLNENKITFPTKKEQELVESSIVGHPGLITTVVNYLRFNPHYKPNRTHNNIVKLISSEVQKLLQDFLADNVETEKAVAIFGEAYILSYEEILSILKVWPGFDLVVESLMDVGFLLRNNGDYQLAPYLQRYANTLTERHFNSLKESRKVLLNTYDTLTDDAFVPIQLLNARIVEHIISGTEIKGVLKNLVMPSQQLKAARRKYDEQDYAMSLHLAREAYEQVHKLSENGVLEAWRLIGLSAIRHHSNGDFVYFVEQYNSIPKSNKRETIYYFAKGFKYRNAGNLREAKEWYLKIKTLGIADSHVYRELAYIYAFEEDYDEALNCITQATHLTPSNPYILDIRALILLEKYKNHKSTSLYDELNECLQELQDADKREGTFFWSIRESTKEILINGDVNSLLLAYKNRDSLRIHAKVTLLRLLSIKGKNTQFDQLQHEIEKTIRDNNNQLAKIELGRIEIEHYAAKGDTQKATDKLNQYRSYFTPLCVDNLNNTIKHFAANK